MATLPTILLVDDEERFRTNLSKLLAAHGYEVTTADSGPRALAELARQPFDVVLLDVRMPAMSGLETLKAIKQDYPDSEVIILTGHASVDAAAEVIRLGGSELLLKPCPLEEIIAKIETAYERKLARRE
jgi:DNA-binding NtrC family response regulator|uniref:Response regulator n=1 Tax=Desulfobacca acetoxidans TaxID=60893 RepID=A0A7C3V4N7_9BACT